MAEEAPWTIGRLLNWTKQFLTERGADSPRLDAEVLLAHARGCKRIELYTAFEDEAPQEVRDKFRDLVRRRAAGAPVAYLVGHREFYSLDFEVSADVLIPRPETEHLVVALTDHARAKGRASDALRVLDLGTGSGILAICAAKHLPGAHVVGIDISPGAVQVASRNATKHGVAERVRIVQGDLFQPLGDDDVFDYILSNPPYVTSAELAGLAPDVRNFEPQLALDGGPQGLDVYARIVPQSVERLKPGGRLILEVGPTVAAGVEALIDSCPDLQRTPTLRDHEGRPRVALADRRPTV